MEITTVRGWIALAGLAVVVAGALTWGILGEVRRVVLAQGIMVAQGDVHRVQATGAGQIDSVLVEPGSPVHRGEPVAFLAQPELRTTIRQLEASLAEERTNRASARALLVSDTTIELASIAEQHKAADEALRASQARITYLDARIENERRAVERKLMTPEAAQNTIALRADAQLTVLGAVARKRELDARAVQIRDGARQRRRALDESISRAENRLEQLGAELQTAATVVSQYDGVVVERLVDRGQSVVLGAPIVTVEDASAPVHVLMFIPLEGKRIKQGMRVEMVPGGVRPEETGYFLGTVGSVSSAPLSGSALDRYLKNEMLVEQFTHQGGAYLVDVVVMSDSTTVSTFKWTSRAGAKLRFGSGTLLNGKIVVETMRPLALVIPAMRRWFGG